MSSRKQSLVINRAKSKVILFGKPSKAKSGAYAFMNLKTIFNVRNMLITKQKDYLCNTLVLSIFDYGDSAPILSRREKFKWSQTHV